MNILITNRVLAGRSGTEVVVRDLSFGLRQRGHTPLVYSPVLGSMAEEIRAHGIAVYDNLRDIALTPDVIHGHHHPQTLASLLRFPNTPAVFVCHDAVSWHDDPLIFPRVLGYVAVDYRSKGRLGKKRRVSPERIRAVSPLEKEPGLSIVGKQSLVMPSRELLLLHIKGPYLTDVPTYIASALWDMNVWVRASKPRS